MSLDFLQSIWATPLWALLDVFYYYRRFHSSPELCSCPTVVHSTACEMLSLHLLGVDNITSRKKIESNSILTHKHTHTSHQQWHLHANVLAQTLLLTLLMTLCEKKILLGKDNFNYYLFIYFSLSFSISLIYANPLRSFSSSNEIFKALLSHECAVSQYKNV